MHISDRAMAFVGFVLGIILPFALYGYMALFARVDLFPRSLVILTMIGFGAFVWVLAAIVYFRDHPARGRTEEDVRRSVRAWYRDAKKWMDEHPEHTDMKDL